MNRPLSLALSISAASLLLLTTAPTQAEEVPLGATLSGLLGYAREHNPDLAAFRLDAAAARERIESEAALPDPRFQLELMDVTNTMSGGGASLLPGEVGQTSYRVTQPLPFWGKRALRGEVAETLAGQSMRIADVATLEVEARIKTAFARYYQAHGQTAILTETLTLVDALGRLVETRYGVGLVPQQDVVQAHSEVTSLKVDLVEAQRRVRDAVAKLNAQLPRAADAPLAQPVALPTVAGVISLSDVFEKAKSRAPELARERLGIDAAAKSRDLVYLNRYPDFAVGLTNNRPSNGSDSWNVMLEINIPLQQASRRAQEREAERRMEAATSRVEAAEARLNGSLGEAQAAFAANGEKARLLRHTLLPQSRANLEAAQAGYETGQVNFNTLIEAERQILRTRLALLDAEVEIRVQQTELERLVGASL